MEIIEGEDLDITAVKESIKNFNKYIKDIK
jgi:hypothetical protein